MQLSFVSTIIAAILMGQALASTAGTLANFASTCKNIVGSGSILTANCGNGKGGYVQAELDLNNCVGNNNGKLVW